MEVNIMIAAEAPMPPMDEATYHRLLDTFLPSEEMRAYLKTQPMLPEMTIRQLIAGSPVPLEEKAKWVWGTDKEMVERSLSELTARPGELFTLVDAWYDEDIREAKYRFNAPFLHFDQVLSHIRAELAEEVGDIGDWRDSQWYEVQKWTPNGNGELVGVCTYWLLGDQVTYFKWKDWLKECRADTPFNSCCPEPNLPVPFRPGEILTINCRPFAPVKHALLLEVGDNRDCCCLQALCRDEKTGCWITGAVKHSSLFSGPYVHPLYTPVYRLTRFTGDLPLKEQLLLKVQRAMGGDEANGTYLWKKINDPNNNSSWHKLSSGKLTRLLAELAEED